jgi:hypothetical protein
MGIFPSIYDATHFLVYGVYMEILYSISVLFRFAHVLQIVFETVFTGSNMVVRNWRCLDKCNAVAFSSSGN